MIPLLHGDADPGPAHELTVVTRTQGQHQAVRLRGEKYRGESTDLYRLDDIIIYCDKYEDSKYILSVLGAAGVVPGHVPGVAADEEAGHVRVGDSGDGGVVGDGHVPLVQLLVVLDHRVLLPDVAQQPRPRLIHHHVAGVKPGPGTQHLKF